VYYFDQFDTKVDIVSYTDEEYEQYLQDPDWTREETDYLWSLCSDFDLRWIVIVDRYEWKETEGQERTERTMEDLKDRYFSGVQKLLVGRTPESLMTTDQLEQYNSYEWDKSTRTVCYGIS
jgi:DNA methyltransferase 1-associated protein 1